MYVQQPCVSKAVMRALWRRSDLIRRSLLKALPSASHIRAVNKTHRGWNVVLKQFTNQNVVCWLRALSSLHRPMV
jgi:hypothetical protein